MAVSGLLSIGPSGDNYPSITAAIADIQSQGLGGPVTLELQSDYVGTVESYPLTFSNLGTTSVNTLTVRPASNVGKTLTSASSTATVDLNGAQFVTIDGRAGGIGTGKMLAISNTSLSGTALRFINEASHNIIRNVALTGVNSSSSKGVVFFSTTTGTEGNDNNTIDSCDISAGTSSPANGLYSRGSTGTADQSNSGNVVSNSSIRNFYSNTIDASGVRLDVGNSDWTISGNSFDQNATRTAVAGTVRGIYVNDLAGHNFNIIGNFIGGGESNPSGSRWQTVGTTHAYLFRGIQVNVGTTTPSSIQGNTIQNFLWTSSAGGTLPSTGPWTGIYVSAGSVDIGTLNGNTIGNGNVSGSINVMTSGSGGTIVGIGSTSSGTVMIQNNTIESILTRGTTTSISASVVGIHVTAGTNTISNNTVGRIFSSDSLNALTSSTSSVGQSITGILSSSTASTTVSGNTVAGLNNNYVGVNTSGQTRGIATLAGTNTIDGNTVRDISSASQNAGTGVSSSVIGVLQASTIGNQTVSQNDVSFLSNTDASASVTVIGIYFAGSTTLGSSTVARNRVRELDLLSNSGSANLIGLYFADGAFIAKNNMVSVDLYYSAFSTNGSMGVYGIYDAAATDGRYFYFNSVNVGGARESGTSPTFAFLSVGVTNARDFRNNIFSNNVYDFGGNGKHYAVQYGGTTTNPSGLQADNNLFFNGGTNTVFGRFNGIDFNSLNFWRTVTGLDSESLKADPKFVTSSYNLHLQNSSPAEGRGVSIAGITDDFDGDVRNPTSPNIGADEYAADTTPPTIVSVIASGSIWSPAFIDAVDGGATGTGNGLGYMLTPHSTVPNSGVDRIYIQFSEPVVGFDMTSIKLLGVNVTDYAGFMTASYDSANMRGVIQLSASVAIDKLRIGVSDSIKDSSLNPLDGDQNGLAGGLMDLRFNVLVGDANSDGSVNGGDLPLFSTSFNKSVGNVLYNPRADWNSDSSINGGDLPLFSGNFNQSLPAAEPAALDFPPPAIQPQSLEFTEDSIDTSFPNFVDVDDFFCQFEEDDDTLQ